MKQSLLIHKPEKGNFLKSLFFLVLLFIILFPDISQAQGDRFAITGQIANFRWTGRLVNGIQVTLTGPAPSTANVLGSPQNTAYNVGYASDGWFTFFNLTPGNYNLRIYTNTRYGDIKSDIYGTSGIPGGGTYYDTTITIIASDVYLHRFYAQGRLLPVTGLVDSSGYFLANVPMGNKYVYIQERGTEPNAISYYRIVLADPAGNYTISDADAIDCSGNYRVGVWTTDQKATGAWLALTDYTLSNNNGATYRNLDAFNGPAAAIRNLHYQYNPRTISGNVKLNGVNLPNVSITLTGPTRATPVNTITDISGNYSFANLPSNWGYVITPSLPGYDFIPPVINTPKLTNNLPNQNFIAILKQYTISGVITDGPDPLTHNVYIHVDSTVDNGATWIPVTGSPFGPFNTGSYSFKLNGLGFYRARASDGDPTPKLLYPSRAILSDYLQNDKVQDFYTDRDRHWIRGVVTRDPLGDPGPIENLVINAVGNLGYKITTATNDSGKYEFLVPNDQEYTVTPLVLAQATWNPNSYDKNTMPGLALNADVNDVNFTITYKPKVLVTGKVQIDGTTTGLADVRVVITGNPGYSLTTDASGLYSFMATQGESYSIEAFKEGYDMLNAPRTIGPIGPVPPATGAFPINARLRIHTISGNISLNGTNLVPGFVANDIQITTSSTTPLNKTYSSLNGNYSFQVDELNSYAVTPVKNGYDFTPVNREYAYVKDDRVNEDYIASIKKFTISGYVTQSLVALPGVSVTCTGQPNVYTDANGYYSFSVDAFGDYQLTAAKAGYSIVLSPGAGAQPAVFNDLAGNAQQNFEATTINTLSIYGKVWNAGSLLSGANVKLFKKVGPNWVQADTTIITNAVINIYSPSLYKFDNLEAHSDYKVEVTATGFTFLPNAGNPDTGSYTFTDLITSQAQDFVTNSEVYQISGKINNLASGVYVPVKVVGSQSFTTQGTTDANGIFTVTVPAGFSYTIIPQSYPDQGYTYSSTSDGDTLRTTPVITGAITDQDFNATPRSYTISGFITPFNLTGLNISCTGATGITYTPATGYYTMNVTAHNNYTIIPTCPGYNFSPADKSWEDLVGNKTQNFTGSIGKVTISGHITLGGSALSEAKVSCTGQADVFSDINGYYSFRVNAFGTYDISVSKTGYSFSPTPPVTLGPLTIDATQDFTASTTNTLSIYGKIWNNGALLAGASVQLYKYSGGIWSAVGSPIVTNTTTNPYSPYLYRFDNLETHSDYRVQVTATGFTFLPNAGTPSIGSYTFTDMIADQNQDFVTNSNVYEISGKINGLAPGVYVPILVVGTQSFTTHGITNVGGTYSITVPAGFSYTINPQALPDQGYYYTSTEAGHTTDTIRVTPVVTEALTDLDFNAERKTYTISGYITPIGLTGLIVTCPGASNIIYNPVTGYYSMNVLAHGTYIVKPILSGYTFNPLDQTWVDLVGNKVQDFFATSALVPILQDPSNGNTSIGLTPTMKWLPPPAGTTPATYLLQISTSLSFGTLAGGSPYTVPHSGTNPQEQIVTTSLSAGTQYFWRVRANFPDGSSSDWSNVWNFTTSVAPPDPPARMYPTDLSIRVSTRPDFGWTAAARATRYLLQIKTGPSELAPSAVPDIEINDLSTAYRLLTSLNPSTTYYWRVGSWNSSSTDYSWSTNGTTGPKEWWSFTTGMPVPEPLTPASGSIGLPITNVQLTWRTVPPGPAPDRYHIQFATTSDFQAGTILINEKVATTFIFPDSYVALTTSTTYYWRVSGILGATDPQTDESAWSEVMSFTTVSPTPQPISPINNALVSLQPMLLWGPSNGAQSYDVELYSSSNYAPGSKIILPGGTNIPSTQTFYNIPAGLLSNATHYYWKVRAITGTGASEWSNIVFVTIDASFTTSALIPLLKSPVNGAIGQPVNIRFEWYPVTGATSYVLQYSKDPNFNTKVERTNISATFQNEVNLEMNATYFWRVKVESPVESGWSEIWYFSVGGTFSWDPDHIDYGNVIIRKTKSANVTLYNNGANPVVIPALEFTDPNFDSPSITQTPIIIPAFSNKVITVNFTPTTLGAKAGKLRIYHNVSSQPANPIEIPLTGNSVSTLAMIEFPPELDFGTVAVLSGPVEKVITIKNLSLEDADIVTLTSGFFETASNIFQLIGGYPIFISPGQSANIVVRFNPQRVGVHNNNIHILNTSLNAPDAKIRVKGTVVDGNLVVIPSSLDFGQTSIGEPSKVDTVYLINYGVTPVTVFSKIITLDTLSFHFVKNSGQITLLTNQTDTVIIKFEPHDANGRKNALLDITCDDRVSTKRYVPMTGIAGDDAVITVDPLEIDFGVMIVGETKDTTFIIRNDGSLDLLIKSLALLGNDKDMFFILTKIENTIINSKSYIIVTIRAIGKSVGDKTAKIEIYSSDKNNPVIPVSLKAVVRSPIFWKSLDNIVWDTVATKNCVDTVFKIGNIGNMNLHVSKYYIDGPNANDFKVISLATSFDMQPGEIKEVTVRYCPKESGMRYARLVFVSNDPVNPIQAITLRSNTITIHPELVVDTLIDFGYVTVNAISKREFLMQNISKFSDLSIDSIKISFVQYQPFSYAESAFPILIPRNGDFTIQLQFQPTVGEVKRYSAYLYIYYSNPLLSPARVKMIGGVIRPKADVDLQEVLKFGKVPLDSAKTQTFKVKNSGDGDLIVDKILRIGPDSAEFTVNTEIPFTVEPDNVKVVSVTFLPKKLGPKDAQLQIVWNDLTNPGIIEIWAEGVPKGSGVLSIRNGEIPKEFDLAQNYPNPFNPSTKIEYSLPKSEFVTIRIYNSLGQEMETLVKELQSPGVYSVEWNPHYLSSGVYYYRLQAGKFNMLKKMLYIR